MKVYIYVMPTLYSYCITYDYGSAPNPYFGICTLAICKPVIRRTAQKDDWIVATGSKQYGFENCVVYAMKITDIKSLREYDIYCREHLPNKIPDWNSKDVSRRVGDCIYDYSSATEKPLLRNSVHKLENLPRDLEGKNVLISDHFYYFGSDPMPLPSGLLKIVRHGQGHKSKSNDPYKDEFMKWIESFANFKNKINSQPYLIDELAIGDDNCRGKCSTMHLQMDDEDELSDCE